MPPLTHARANLHLQAQFLYSAAFNELVRQVSTHCVERGRLLARIWQSYIALFVKMVEVRTSWVCAVTQHE